MSYNHIKEIYIILLNVNFNRDFCFIGVVLYTRGNDPLCFGMDSASSWIRILCWNPRGNLRCTNCCRSEYNPIYDNKKIDKTSFYILLKLMITELYNSQIIFRCLPSSIPLHMDLDHSSYGMITNQRHPNCSDQNNLLF